MRNSLRSVSRVASLLIIVVAGVPLSVAADTAARVRHAPVVNGAVDGSLHVMLPENVTLNGGAAINGDLKVPGTPAVRLNGKPSYVSTIDDTGASGPSNYEVALNGSAALRHVVRRTDPVALLSVASPHAPVGTRT